MEPKFELQNYKFFTQLRLLPFVKKIILYGSRARGDNGPRSDIDLAIETEATNREDWYKVLEIIEEADTLLGIDCVHLNTLGPDTPLRQAIERDGKLIYQI
jgi:predicted nucleotidyltransferase